MKNKFISRHQFLKMYSTEEACLETVFRLTCGHLKECPGCKAPAKFYPVKGRKCYECNCGFQLYPMTGTIFQKSRTKLTTWFSVLYDFLTAKEGMTAKHIERTHGMTYKCAHAMLHRIRKGMREPAMRLKGVVQMDETYWGGRKRLAPLDGFWGIGDKAMFWGAIERNGGKLVIILMSRKDAKT